MAQVGESLEMLARVYHTENGNVHAEGEQYAVTDRVLAETLYGTGFASPVGWSPDLPPPPGTRAAGDPDPEHGRHDDSRHGRHGR
jgi:hypothetical protein